MKYLAAIAVLIAALSMLQTGRLAKEVAALSEQVMAQSARLGTAAVLTTATSDTLETFRTNVNTSLANLQTDNVSTTTAYTWTQAQAILGALTVGATATTTISTSGTVGIASSSPLGKLGIGTTGATSTISGGFFCSYFKDEAGRGMWIKLATSGNVVFATSTTACN